VAVRNCYQFGGDTVKGKIGRGASGILRGRIGGCEGSVELNEKTELCPREEISIIFLSVRGRHRETSATADAASTPTAQVVIIVIVVVVEMIECNDRQLRRCVVRYGPL